MRYSSITRSSSEADEEYLRQRRDETRTIFYSQRWNIWMDFAGTTTLHGPIHITTTRGLTHIYYIVVILFMTAMFVTHTTNLVQQYFSYPILTEIKYNNLDYSYPDITICPSSPFTEKEAENNPDILKILNSSTEFWWQARDVLNSSPNARIKRSVTRRFFEQSGVIGRLPHRHVIHCLIAGSDCLDQLRITEHTLYYRCFTLRVRPTPPVPAGPTHGIRLLLHRGSQSPPSLLIKEEEPYFLQSILKSVKLKEKDGWFIAFHETDTVPNFPLQQLPNGLALQYGTFNRISLAAEELNSVNLKGRKCVETDFSSPIQLTRHDAMSESNFDETNSNSRLAEFQYTRQSCIANLRQKLTKTLCGCFSEAYSIPYSMRDFGQTWCHDIEMSTNKLIHIHETLGCMQNIENNTDAEILQSVNVDTSGDGVEDCPLRCNLRTHSIHSHFTTRLAQNVSTNELISYIERIQLLKLDNETGDIFVKREDGEVDANDLIYLDISPVSESMNQIIEQPGYTLLQLFSEFGGVSGLYVGITVYTLAEILDLITRFLSIYIPYILASLKYIALRDRNLKQGELINEKEEGKKEEVKEVRAVDEEVNKE